MKERKWLAEIRKAKGKTQVDVAHDVGMAQASYSDIENGVNNPRFGTMRRISEALGFPMVYWMQDGEDQQQAES